MANQTAPTDFIESGVEFLTEQDGVPERELKAELHRCLQDTTVVQRAYLAAVQYSGKSVRSIALCLVAEPGCESKIVPTIGAVFSKMFNPKEHLDILFVDDQQELKLAHVCKPFFIRIPMG